MCVWIMASAVADSRLATRSRLKIELWVGCTVRSQGRPLQWKCELGEHPDGWFAEYIS